MDQPRYWGHFDEMEGRVQSLQDHLCGTAERSRCFANSFGEGSVGELLGMYHDIGKYSKAFQAYLRADPEKRRKLRGSVDHSTAGAQELFHQRGAAAIPFSFCIAGHHGGIPDLGTPADTGADSTLFGRLKRKDIPSYESYKEEAKLPPCPQSTPLRDAACREGYVAAMLYVRMLFSCLVDADFLDTEAFLSKGETKRAGFDAMEQLLVRFTKCIAERFGKDKVEASALNRKRAEILQRSIACGDSSQGSLYKMGIPTGGGKTIASLAFALHHAVHTGKKRILYVIPYTSIIEQNAKVFRDLLGEENVIEHHGQVDYDAESDGERKRLAAENWDAPVIVTTNVQFFESLFGNRPSKCRKLHNIAESVIIFDEAQMIPLGYLRPSMEAVRALVRAYRCTAVLCTATQPPLEQFFPNQTWEEIISLTAEEQALFRRTAIRLRNEPLSMESMAKQLEREIQVLCIVNTKTNAYELYSMLLQREGTFHLSTNLCPVDRERILEKIRICLRDGKPCRVVSTSLVEAGVDLDFPKVYREISGLDSIVQAAGRCNREGRRTVESSVVQVFSFENLAKSQHFPAAVTNHTAQQYGADIASPASIAAYFSELYDVAGENRLDRKGIIPASKNFSFVTIANAFRFIEENTVPVFIPITSKAEELLNRLKEGERSRSLMRKAGRYMVMVRTGPGSPFETLRKKEMIALLDSEIAYLTDFSAYDTNTGPHAKAESGNGFFF